MDVNGLLSVQVLGPIRAVDSAGRDVTPDDSLQRRLFALLVLHRGRVVSADAAVEALWPGDPPLDPRAAMHNHVSRLRRGVPAGVVSSAGDGYRLDPDLVDVDADRLAELIGGGVRSKAAADQLGTRWRDGKVRRIPNSATSTTVCSSPRDSTSYACVRAKLGRKRGWTSETLSI